MRRSNGRCKLLCSGVLLELIFRFSYRGQMGVEELIVVGSVSTGTCSCVSFI